MVSTRNRLSRAVLALLAVAALAAPVAAATIAREGEDPTVNQMNRHPWWYDKVKRYALSGGDWISNFSEEKEGLASYAIDVPETARYAFWVRANPVAVSLSYRVDDGAWAPIDMKGAVDTANIAEDDKIDLRFVAWKKVGDLELAKGKHTVHFRMHSENSNHGALDVFVLTTDAFTPQGPLQPAGGVGATAFDSERAWPFLPADDKFTGDALLDLRYLNEKVAGQSGRLRLSADGSSFVRGDGKPIRLWAVGTDIAGRESIEEMKTHARFLAKRGVNMVRFHTYLPNNKEGAKITDVNEKVIDGIFKAVAACKNEGIYVTISPYWAHGEAPKSWGLEGCDGKGPWGVLFFNDRLKEAYKAWVKPLYTRKNPYTGIALKDDPAVGIIQIKNEDSLLFWTLQGVPKPQLRILGKKYGDWAAKAYGSIDKAMEAWGGTKHGDDDPAAGVLGFFNIWNLLQPAQGGRAQRLHDELRFLATTQREFFEEIRDYYRNELGCKQLINAMNWRSADPVLMDDAERWTYAAADVIAVNRYVDSLHIGKDNGWRIDAGHVFRNDSALRQPDKIPTGLKQIAGRPMLITESTWVHPTAFQTEGPFLVAAYESLTGVDGFYWFAATEVGYKRDLWFVPGWMVNNQQTLHKWTCSLPQFFGQFPAAALLYRRGYLKQGDVAVHEERTLENLWDKRVPIISESGKFDPNRDQGHYAPESTVKQDVDRKAFLVGPVEVVYGGDPAKNRVADLKACIDPEKKVVVSNTGEIRLDYGVGLCTIDAPKAQGAAGFLKEAGGRVALADLAIDSTNEYAAVLAVAMDDKPLAASARVLVQVGTVVRMTGWLEADAQVTDQGKTIAVKRIVSTGRLPMRVANTEVTVTLKNAGLTKATLLDVNGYAVREVPVKRDGGAVAVELPAETLYLVLE